MEETRKRNRTSGRKSGIFHLFHPGSYYTGRRDPPPRLTMITRTYKCISRIMAYVKVWTPFRIIVVFAKKTCTVLRNAPKGDSMPAREKLVSELKIDHRCSNQRTEESEKNGSYEHKKVQSVYGCTSFPSQSRRTARESWFGAWRMILCFPSNVTKCIPCPPSFV